MNLLKFELFGMQRACGDQDRVLSMEELLVNLDAWKYWKEKALHVNIII